MTKSTIYSSKYLNVVKDGTWEYVTRTTGKDVVYIVPVTCNKFGEPEFVFIRELRIPMQQFVVGFPAGLVGDLGDEEIITAAYRELEEETGYQAGRMRHLVSGPPSAGLSDETIHFYLADKLTKVGIGGGDDSEDIDVIRVPVHKAESWLASRSDSIDIKSYLGLWFASRMDLE
ncbi:MAG TPA: DNA mismatch repair protein MutT [Flavobacteriales bacterium]|nr:DNA mismatch repair protein MutT [Flavobacteriales bacterium]